MAVSSSLYQQSAKSDLRSLVSDSLMFCVSKTGCCSKEGVLERLRANDEWSLSYLAYACAVRLARLAAENNQGIRAAYVAGLEGDESSIAFYPVILVLCADKATKEAIDFAGFLESELPAWLVVEAGLSQQKAKTLLNIFVLGQEEVGQGKAFASMISSMWSPPLKVWPE